MQIKKARWLVRYCKFKEETGCTFSILVWGKEFLGSRTGVVNPPLHASNLRSEVINLGLSLALFFFPTISLALLMIISLFINCSLRCFSLLSSPSCCFEATCSSSQEPWASAWPLPCSSSTSNSLRILSTSSSVNLEGSWMVWTFAEELSATSSSSCLFPNVPIASNDWGQSLNSSLRHSDTLPPAHY